MTKKTSDKGKSAAQSQDREHFRLVYPVEERPTMSIKQKVYPVLDVSEAGVRFRGSPHEFAVNTKIEGEIIFKDGAAYPVEGLVFRVANADQYIVQLMKPVPLSRMMAEQRRLIALYKDL